VKQLSSHGEPPPIGAASTLARLWRWALGTAITVLRYSGQRVPTYLRHRRGRAVEVPDPARELPGDPATLQRSDEGHGPLFHRSFSIAVTDERLDEHQLLALVADDPNQVTPTEMARFETFDGALARDLQVGDELVVRLPGPWDGPVRVIERTPTTLRLATLRGHMEAGEIRFATWRDDRDFLRFQIDTWARSGDRLFHVLYETLPLGREIQQHMWSQFCRRVATASGGVRMSGAGCFTERIEP
jgi:hypothetical protein